VSHHYPANHFSIPEGSVIAFVHEDRLLSSTPTQYQSLWFGQYKSFLLSRRTMLGRAINAAIG